MNSGAEHMQPLLNVKGVSFAYGKQDETLHDVSFSMQPGTVLSIIGGNGCGKSTLARICCGLASPSKGSAELLGTAIDKTTDLSFLASTVGMVMQDPEEQLVNGIVKTDVAFGPCNLGLPEAEVRKRAQEALEAVGLSALADAEVSTLSGGQKQRLAIAGALALKPKLLILDECTSMLDPASASQVRAIIGTLSRSGMGIINITHDLHEASLADQVIALQDGRIAAQGSPEELLADKTLLRDIHLLPCWTEKPERLANLQDNDSDPAISFNEVSFAYPGNQAPALSEITANVMPGTICGIAGASGCGKSTMLLHVNALLEPSKGTVRTCGLDTAKKGERKEIRKRASFMMQYPQRQLFAKTVFEDVSFGPINLGWSKDDVENAARDAMSQLGLDESLESRNPFHLSGGQQRRVALAGVIAMHPRVLALDEPAAGLDPEGRAQLGDLLIKLADEGTTVIFSSHNMEDLARLCDTVVILKEGRILAQGPAGQILADEELMESAGLLAL